MVQGWKGLLVMAALAGGGVPSRCETLFSVAQGGCSMAHCDSRLSDQDWLPVPPAGSTLRWQSNSLPSELAGSYGGLGCSGNGTIAACTFSGPSDNLVVYGYNGHPLWTSKDLLNANTF